MRRFFAIFLALVTLFSTPALAASGERDTLREAAQAAIDACTDETMTDVEKLTALHDWLALRCDYGDPMNGATAHSAIVNGQAVCVGYAAGLAYLFDLAGLDGADTYSTALDHAWALATVDGSRYFSDCVWDDGKAPTIGLVRHTYWLFDENNAEALLHRGWDSQEPVPGGDRERAPWAEAMTRVIFYGDYAYYFNNEFRLIRCRRDNWQTEQLFRLNCTWPDDTPDDGRSEVGTGLVLMDGRLYFNTPRAICSVDLAGKGLRFHLRPDTSEGLIFGIDVRDGVLAYGLATGPDVDIYKIIQTDIPAADAWGY